MNAAFIIICQFISYRRAELHTLLLLYSVRLNVAGERETTNTRPLRLYLSPRSLTDVLPEPEPPQAQLREVNSKRSFRVSCCRNIYETLNNI